MQITKMPTALAEAQLVVMGHSYPLVVTNKRAIHVEVILGDKFPPKTTGKIKTSKGEFTVEFCGSSQRSKDFSSELALRALNLDEQEALMAFTTALKEGN